MKKAIVTGATGFIGSAFVEYLIKKDIEVLALGRKEVDEISDIRWKKIKSADYLKLDMNEISLLGESISGMGWQVGDDCIFFKDVAANHYRKLVVNDGLLVGAILYGNVADGSWYFQLIQNKTNVSDMLELLVFGEAYCRPKVA